MLQNNVFFLSVNRKCGGVGEKNAHESDAYFRVFKIDIMVGYYYIHKYTRSSRKFDGNE